MHANNKYQSFRTDMRGWEGGWCIYIYYIKKKKEDTKVLNFNSICQVLLLHAQSVGRLGVHCYFPLYLTVQHFRDNTCKSMHKYLFTPEEQLVSVLTSFRETHCSQSSCTIPTIPGLDF